MKSLLVVFSYHHHNTEKIAKVLAQVLNAQMTTPQQVNPSELQKYDLVGFGSGIDSDKHYKPLLDLVDKLPNVADKKAFIFSTCGNPFDVQKYAVKCHSSLREKLISKGYVIVDEYISRGFNTNVFLKYFGGINKGQPNAEDFKRAENFAEKLKKTKI
jgi:flavodoxin